MNIRIGIFGGTFDPLHMGHLTIVQEIRTELDLREIYLMPNYIPPHKKPAQASDSDRLAMINILCQEYRELKCLDYEIRKEETSYLSNTLQNIRKLEPFCHCDLFFIIGMDSLLTFPAWHCPEIILQNTNLAVASRPGFNLTDCPDDLAARIIPKSRIQEYTNGQIVLCATSQIDISSTLLRDQNLNFIKEHVPHCIYKYIKEHNLYHYDKR